MNSPPKEEGTFARILSGLFITAEWFQAHKDQIGSIGRWGAVSQACLETQLYAPKSAEAWEAIREAPRDTTDYAALIISLYAPAGAGHQELRCELLEAPLLRERRGELEEVLASLADERYYVTACGALPLVEFVLAKAAGRWKHPNQYALRAKLEAPGALSAAERTALMLEGAAVDMLAKEVPRMWQNDPQRLGPISYLNRHRALHGTGLGWHDRANATRAVLLLAASALVAGPLLSPDGTPNWLLGRLPN